MNTPKGLKYTTEHEWVAIEGKKATVGITDFAQSELGDIVYLELPEETTALNIEQECGIIESVKTVSNIYAPLDGSVIEVNSELIDTPEKINEAPYENWLFKIELSEETEIKTLMSSEEYNKHVYG